MKKVIFFIIFAFVFLGYCFSQTVSYNRITIEITNVVINGGIVYISIFSTAENFRNETPDFTFALEAENTSVFKELSLPNGEYLISAFQDANNNQRLDYNLFGIPRELVGMSNYFGRGFPSRNFDRHKIMVDSSTGKITIGLYRL
jgi:uncharacterized protein (DUF2141 family)